MEIFFYIIFCLFTLLTIVRFAPNLAKVIFEVTAELVNQKLSEKEETSKAIQKFFQELYLLMKQIAKLQVIFVLFIAVIVINSIT